MGSYISFPLMIISSLRENPLFYNIYYAISFVYLKILQLLKKNRFDLYNFKARGQPYKNGFFVPKGEWELETPRDARDLKKFSDNAFCFATNSSNDYLAVHISRLPSGNVYCSVVLRTPDGREFCMPHEHTIQRSTSEENTFGSSRLKLQCLIPMRKWRIFFNGILQEISVQEPEKKYKHIKFTLLWSPSTDIFDFTHDMSPDIILDAAASQTYGNPRAFIQKLKSTFDSYQHPGMFSGTIKIDHEEEKEIYLWGAKGRYMGELPDKKSNIVEIFGSFDNGSCLCLGNMNCPGVLKLFPYGYFMRSDGNIFAIDNIQNTEETIGQAGTKIYFSAGNQDYTLHVNHTKVNQLNVQNNVPIQLKTLKLEVNGKIGNGFLIEKHFQKHGDMQYLKANQTAALTRKILLNSRLLTISFTDERCQDSSLTGGKGSSLAKLLKLSSLLKSKAGKSEFIVPNGIVVTTHSYNEFVSGTLEGVLSEFEADIWNGSGSEMTTLCIKIVDMVGMTKLPENVTQSILLDLETTFGDISEKKFSIRSSATGEDTEQMSAAGQMETYLGVKGFHEILRAVSKCWASQFTFQAIEYKRRYGQKINTPMAVVIQEMISCESAGVMFTCDPVTGNPLLISITGNWGLGESVVSGSAEPDTIILKKDIEKNKVCVLSQSLGDKKTRVIMDQSFGVKEVNVTDDQSTSCCINEETAIRLAQIALEIEKFYGSSRDTEWGIADSNIFFFQSRPVTSIDIDTDFETKHFFDTFLRTDKEFFSKANVGEVMPGAASILGTDMIWKMSEIAYHTQVLKWDRQKTIKKPFFLKKIGCFMNHWLFAMLEGFFSMDSEPSDFSKSFIISMFGRLIDDSEMRRIAKERFALAEIEKIQLWEKIGLTIMLFYSGIMTRQEAKKAEDLEISLSSCDSAKELFEKISKEYDKFAFAMNAHLHCTFSSSMWNLPILSILSKSNGDWDTKVFGDFATLIKTSSHVISADVPAATEDLADEISRNIDPETFQELKPEEALKWLETNSFKSGEKFKNFKKNHGHRCIKEFDVMSETWDMNPYPLIMTLQALVSKNANSVTQKNSESIWKSLSNLNIKLSFLDKLKLLFIVPNARRGVREREFSKSLFIKSISKLRRPLHRLGELMVEEGRLPRKELIFYLCFEEIYLLLQTRSPRLVSKAFKRWKCQNELDELIFPEIMAGIPKPIEQEDTYVSCENGFTMTGVPVSQGISKAPARVIMSVKEANSIQNGDILITYSTDIAWSPYFPRLSGVVTELGGLISHGAVVAREYGLPCVVALHGATKSFKTGDIVVLDGNKGTLQKVG